MEKNLSNAFSEVLDMLNYIEIEYTRKVPENLLQIFKDECNKNYLQKLLTDKTDVTEKDYSDDALAIIAYLNLKYWCETNEEKKYYRNMYLKK